MIRFSLTFKKSCIIIKQSRKGEISILSDAILKLTHTDPHITILDIHRVQFPTGNEVDYQKPGRNDHLLHYVLSGERRYDCNGESFHVGADTVIFIPRGTNYRTRAMATSEGIGIRFQIMPDIPPEIQQAIFTKKCNNPAIKALFVSLNQINAPYPTRQLQVKAQLYQLLSKLVDISYPKEYSVLSPAIDYIKQHFRENIAVDTYAKQCNLSESHFRKLFLRLMGISPIEYRNELRFVEAKRLYQCNMSLQQVAEQVGFCDAGYLARLYKKYTGKSLRRDSDMV